MCYMKTVTMFSNNRKLLVRLQGGLGNQLYQYATAKAIANLQNRELIIDPRPIFAEAPARHYDLGEFKLESENFGTPFQRWMVRWLASVRLGRVFKMFNPYAWNFKMIRDAENGFDESLLKQNSGNLIIQGYWQSFKYFEDIRPILIQEFEVKSRPDSINQKYLNRINSVNSVCIHVRRGDYVNNPTANKIHGVCDLDYYYKGMKYINSKVHNPNYFVFTDDPEWVENNFQTKYKLKIVKHNLGKKDFEDLRLMTNCKHFIIANSSYSWWGAWLSNNQDKIVIAPKKWFNLDNFPAEDRIPREWVRL